MPISAPALPFDLSLQAPRTDASAAITGPEAGVSGDAPLSFASLLAGAAPAQTGARLQPAVVPSGETSCLMVVPLGEEGEGLVPTLPGSSSKKGLVSPSLNEHPGRVPLAEKSFPSRFQSNPAVHPSAFGRSVAEFASTKESDGDVATFVAANRESLQLGESRPAQVRSVEDEDTADLVSTQGDIFAAASVGIPLVAPVPAAVNLSSRPVGLTPTISLDPSTTAFSEAGSKNELLTSPEPEVDSRGNRLALGKEDFSGGVRGRETARLQENHPGVARAVGKTPRPTGDETPRPTGDETPRPTGDETSKPTGESAPKPMGEETPRPTGEETPKPMGEKVPKPTGEKALPMEFSPSAGSPPRKTSAGPDLPSADVSVAVNPKEKQPVTSEALVHAGEHASDRALERGRAFVSATPVPVDSPVSEPLSRASAPRAVNGASVARAEFSRAAGSEFVAIREVGAVDQNVSRANPEPSLAQAAVGPEVSVRNAAATPSTHQVPTWSAAAAPSTPHVPTWNLAATRPNPGVSLDTSVPAESSSQTAEPAFEAGWHLGRFLGREDAPGFAHTVTNFAVPSWNTAAASPWITPRSASTAGSPPPFAGSLEQVPVLPIADPATPVSPTAGNLGVATAARAVAISGSVVVEKFAAGPSEKLVTGLGERGISKHSHKKSSLSAGNQRVNTGEFALGTEAATRVSPMHQDFRAARAVPSSEESFSSVSAPAATSTVSGSAGQSLRMETPETAVPSSAVQAIRRVMDAVDSVWASERPRMDLKLKFDDVGVAVRVEYRDGAITATFQADSAELRERLTAAWQVQAAGVADQKPYRLSDPVFTSSSSSSSSNSFAGGFSSAQEQSAGGDTARQFAQSRQSESANPSPGSSSLRSTTTPAPSAETRPAVLPGTNARLHAFA